MQNNILEIVLGSGFGIDRGGVAVLKVGYNGKKLCIPTFLPLAYLGDMKRNIAQLSLLQLLHLNASGVFRMCERDKGLGDRSPQWGPKAPVGAWGTKSHKS